MKTPTCAIHKADRFFDARPATHRVTWPDGSKSKNLCTDCTVKVRLLPGVEIRELHLTVVP